MIISGVLVTVVFAGQIEDVEDSDCRVGGGELRGCRKTRGGAVLLQAWKLISGVLTGEATSSACCLQ